jgi:peptidoglycan DL-endopeptidase CwlO
MATQGHRTLPRPASTAPGRVARGDGERSPVRVEPHRRHPTGPRRAARWALPSGLVAAATALVLAVGSAPAGAQPPPPPPDTAEEAQERLDEVQREAEVRTEEWHAARDAVEASRRDAERLRAAVEPARTAAEAARAEEEAYWQEVDAVVMSVVDSGRLDQFNVWATSESPQDVLDSSSALEMVGLEHREVLDTLVELRRTSERLLAEADAAVVRADEATGTLVAEEQAALTEKQEADQVIAEARQLLDRLTPEQRRARDTDDGAPTTPVTGTGVGVRALAAAKTQIGDEYEYGDEGPDSWDCSGLTSWAFKQVGVTLPRSSRQQALVGTPVAFEDIQPGDLVFYYSPVSHVGIAAGDGKIFDAPTEGQSVGYRNISRSAFAGARRL